jgi:hypothetical protein
MSKAIIRTAAARLALSVTLAIGTLILTALVDARPDRGPTPPSTVRFDVPAGAPWCGPVNELGTASCRYLTFERCLEAASANYRKCKPNPAAVMVPDEAPYWTYRSVFL